MSRRFFKKGGQEGKLTHREWRLAILPLLPILTCSEVVVTSTAAVFPEHVLHVTHDLSVLVEPRAPRLGELVERARQIVRLPDVLVLLRQVVPRQKIALRHL